MTRPYLLLQRHQVDNEATLFVCAAKGLPRVVIGDERRLLGGLAGLCNRATLLSEMRGLELVIDLREWRAATPEEKAAAGVPDWAPYPVRDEADLWKMDA